MVINVAVCDDDQYSLDGIIGRLKNLEKENALEFNIIKCEDAKTLLDAITTPNERIHLVLLDVDMPELNGIDVASKIRELKLDVLIIFISAHEKYVFKSIEFNPFRYIRKSVIDSEFNVSIKSAIEVIMNDYNNKEIVLELENGRIVLNQNDIVYFEKELRKTNIYLYNGNMYTAKNSIKDLYSHVNNDNYAKIYPGCVVNLKYIKSYDDDSIYLKTNITIPVSRRRMKDLRDRIAKYWAQKI